MRLIFCSHSANFPKIYTAIVQASAAHHCKLPGLGTVFLLSFVRPTRRTIFWNLEFWSKTPKRSFFGPLLLRHWCTNPCCSTTAQFVFLVRVARYANHFSSLLGSPKIPFCPVQFLSSRTSLKRRMFCSYSAIFPKILAALVQASAAHHCELPGIGTVFLLSFVCP